MIVEGMVLRGHEFTPVEGRVIIDDGRIAAVEEAAVDSTSVILPAFVNAHTHIGDSIAKDAGAGLSLTELVAPPDGLKHRLLRTTSPERLIDGMRRTIRLMEATGTGAFMDFREGGTDGVKALHEASSGFDLAVIALGRDDPAVIETGDGFGASGAADGEFSAERRAASAANALFGIHAGEVDAGDINPALDLHPDFLVHCVQARDVHLERIEDSEMPVVVCPRSNAATGVGLPPIEALADRTIVALGTDNVMTSGPSMFREMAFVDQISDVSPEAILRMATVHGAEIAGLNRGVIAPGKDAALLVLDGESDNLIDSHDIVRSIVRRGSPMDIVNVIL